jgi:hypothetical protein
MHPEGQSASPHRQIPRTPLECFFFHCFFPPPLLTDCISRSTHWKQVLLYLDDPIDMLQDDVISIKLRHSVNHYNHRFVDYVLELEKGEKKVRKAFAMK